MQFSSHRCETNAKSLMTAKHLNGHLKNHRILTRCFKGKRNFMQRKNRINKYIQRRKKNSTKIGDCKRCLFNTDQSMYSVLPYTLQTSATSFQMNKKKELMFEADFWLCDFSLIPSFFFQHFISMRFVSFFFMDTNFVVHE